VSGLEAAMQSDRIRQFLQRCHVPPERLERTDPLRRLYEDLVAANEETNLTRITDAREFWARHVADSLSVGIAVPEAVGEELDVADVGCGAGFPVLPLAWAHDHWRLTAVEPRRRKAAFVEDEVDRLGLQNVQVVARQAREAGRMSDHAGQYDLVTLRAVGSVGKLLREVRGLLRPAPSAAIVFYKTPDAIEEEADLAKREADKFHFSMRASDVIELPDGAKRQFLVLKRA
jgi:16S rRNA (guanine527-N7)-methyltransferase